MKIIAGDSPRICQFCGRPLYLGTTQKKWCSDACGDKARWLKEQKGKK